MHTYSHCPVWKTAITGHSTRHDRWYTKLLILGLWVLGPQVQQVKLLRCRGKLYLRYGRSKCQIKFRHVSSGDEFSVCTYLHHPGECDTYLPWSDYTIYDTGVLIEINTYMWSESRRVHCWKVTAVTYLKHRLRFLNVSRHNKLDSWMLPVAWPTVPSEIT